MQGNMARPWTGHIELGKFLWCLQTSEQGALGAGEMLLKNEILKNQSE